MIPRVLNENCNGCTPNQRDNANRIISFMQTDHADDWALINAKYKSS